MKKDNKNQGSRKGFGQRGPGQSNDKKASYRPISTSENGAFKSFEKKKTYTSGSSDRFGKGRDADRKFGSSDNRPYKNDSTERHERSNEIHRQTYTKIWDGLPDKPAASLDYQPKRDNEKRRFDTNRPDRIERSGRPERTNRPERQDRPIWQDKPERPFGGNREERPQYSSRPDRPFGGNREERPERGSGPDRERPSFRENDRKPAFEDRNKNNPDFESPNTKQNFENRGQDNTKPAQPSNRNYSASKKYEGFNRNRAIRIGNAENNFEDNAENRNNHQEQNKERPSYQNRNEVYPRPDRSGRDGDRAGFERKTDNRFGGSGAGSRPERDNRFGGLGAGSRPERDNRFSGSGAGSRPERDNRFGGSGAGSRPERDNKFGKSPSGGFASKKKNDEEQPLKEFRFHPVHAPKNDKQGKKNENQQDSREGTRLNRYISQAGVCARRDADALIKNGQIEVNGQVVYQLGTMVLDHDKVSYKGKLLSKEKKVYLLLNKPKDYITTTEDPEDRKTVMNLVSSVVDVRIYPVGRLDRNTTGLLLMTNDGELAAKLSHPSNRVSKIYEVNLDKNFGEDDLEKLVSGIELEDGLAKLDEAAFISGSDKTLAVEIHSGKNRIVRRMFEHLGYQVEQLDRVMYAGLTKKGIPRGKWRMLTDMEILTLKHFIQKQ